MYTYTFIRKDLPIQHQMVQACHSALEAGNMFDQPDNVSNLILIGAKNKAHLYEIAEFLEFNNIKYYMFFEPDNNMGHSSLTTEPLTQDQKRILSKFKLWRTE